MRARSKVAQPARRLGLSSEDADPGQLLQARLRLFHGVLFGMTGVLLLISFVFVARMLMIRFDTPVVLSLIVHGVMVVALAASWLILRSRTLSTTALLALDVAVTALLGLLAAGWAALIPPKYRPDLTMLLAMTQILFGRAALVPSSTRRTVGVGAACMVPLVAGVAWTFTGDMVPPWLQPGSSVVTVAAVWAAIIVWLSALTSHVIYGLRRKVAQAMQLGQYTVERLIGRGGMGSVYLAHHSLLRRPTAVKVLEAAAAGDEMIARFEREAQITSQLTHPNTVAIYDYGRTPDASFYYAMEYLDGFDLETLIEIDGVQSPARVVHILRQACGALAEAHERGLVHRDIKPANLMLCERGLEPDFVKVLDFGLVRTSEAGAPALSREMTVRGTPLYMAPESIVAPDHIDGRADVYALGGVAYFLLSGRPPFGGQSPMDVMMRQVHDVPEPPSARAGRPVPAALEALVMACLEKSAERRPASMAALRDALGALEVGAWSEAEARAWWRDRAPTVRAARAAGGPGGEVPDARAAGGPGGEVPDAPPATGSARTEPAPVTVAIDLGGREKRYHPAP
jgi:serine/threonine-protein kinase